MCVVFFSRFYYPFSNLILRIHFLILATGNYPQHGTLRRGQSLLGREEDVHESGLALFKRGTLRRKKPQSAASGGQPPPQKKGGCWKGPGPSGPWMLYCYFLTICIPPFLMRKCGMSLSPSVLNEGFLILFASSHQVFAVRSSSVLGERRWALSASFSLSWLELVS